MVLSGECENLLDSLAASLDLDREEVLRTALSLLLHAEVHKIVEAAALDGIMVDNVLKQIEALVGQVLLLD